MWTLKDERTWRDPDGTNAEKPMEVTEDLYLQVTWDGRMHDGVLGAMLGGCWRALGSVWLLLLLLL